MVRAEGGGGKGPNQVWGGMGGSPLGGCSAVGGLVALPESLSCRLNVASRSRIWDQPGNVSEATGFAISPGTVLLTLTSSISSGLLTTPLTGKRNRPKHRHLISKEEVFIARWSFSEEVAML